MDSGKRPPLDEEKSLFEATLAAEGVTTSAGEGTGLSLVDAKLKGAGANSFVSMMAIIHPGDPQNIDSKDITAFDNGTGGVTVASAFKGGQVAAGVPYKIVTFRFVPAEVAAIDAKIGAFTSVQNLKAILGAYTAAAPLKDAIDAIAGYIDTEVAAIITSQGRQLDRMVKWSAGKVQVQITAAGATVALPTITIENLPDDAVIEEAHLMFKFRMIENKYADVNKLNEGTVAGNSQVFQIQDGVGGAWTDAINLVDDFFTLASEAREGGDVLVGEPNVGVADVVDGNDTYNVQLLLGKADFDFINFDDCQVGLDILYSV